MNEHIEAPEGTNDAVEIKAYCGHTVTKGDAHFHGDLPFCEDCFLEHDPVWFDEADYPEVLRSLTEHVHVGGGVQKVKSEVTLLGIDDERRAVYHDKIDDQLLYVVPLHSDFHDTDDPVTAPLRERHQNQTYGAPADFSDDPFHTMPNGDHLAVVEAEDHRGLSPSLE